jgi:hypothetical protein
LQLVLVYAAPTAAWGFVDYWMGLPDSPASSALAYAWVGGASLALALAAARVAPDSQVEGRWVWVPSALLELVGIGVQVRDFGVPSVRWFFFTAGSAEDRGWLVLFVLTLPTLGCCVYSATVWWLRSRAVSAALADRTGVLRSILVQARNPRQELAEWVDLCL